MQNGAKASAPHSVDRFLKEAFFCSFSPAYMPMIPELAYTMLACARIGAIHSIVFGGFSSESIRDRIIDARAKVAVTANEGVRGCRRLHLKETVDRAVYGSPSLTRFLPPRPVALKPGRCASDILTTWKTLSRFFVKCLNCRWISGLSLLRDS